MAIRPLHDRVIVRRVEEETTTAGGIIIPDTAKEKPSEGEVIAVGPGLLGESGERVAPDVSVGDRVLFGKWSGTEVTINGEKVTTTCPTTRRSHCGGMKFTIFVPMEEKNGESFERESTEGGKSKAAERVEVHRQERRRSEQKQDPKLQGVGPDLHAESAAKRHAEVARPVGTVKSTKKPQVLRASFY